MCRACLPLPNSLLGKGKLLRGQDGRIPIRAGLLLLQDMGEELLDLPGEEDRQLPPSKLPQPRVWSPLTGPIAAQARSQQH